MRIPSSGFPSRIRFSPEPLVAMSVGFPVLESRESCWLL